MNSNLLSWKIDLVSNPANAERLSKYIILYDFFIDSFGKTSWNLKKKTAKCKGI